MRHEGTFDLFNYWNRLRATRSAPDRHEIEPGDIRKRLPETFILEGDGASDAVFRLAGTQICANHGRELKGTSFLSLWAAGDQGMMARLLRTVFNDRRVVLAAFDGINDRGRSTEFELLLLPLAGAVQERRLLGAMFPMDRPYWLGAYPIVECALKTVRVIDANRSPLLLKNRPPLDLAERTPHAAALQPSARPVSGYRRVGHLAVFDGGKRRS